MTRWVLPCFGLLALVLLTSVGCGKTPSGVTVKGKLTNAGQPLKVREMVGSLEMSFYSVEGLASGKPVDPQSASVEKDGTYIVKGTLEDGLKPGKYKIVVVNYDQFPNDPNDDVLKGKFNLQNTKIIRDIQPGMPELNIDVSKPEG